MNYQLSLLIVVFTWSNNVLGSFNCSSPVVCDPSTETGDYLNSAHFSTDLDCERSCSMGHPYNPCKFFTWVPNAGPGVTNCYQMSACHAMADPLPGARSGAWSCEDENLFCGAVADVPMFDERRTVWTCDHDVHPYGDERVNVFQETHCYSTCPSFRYSSSSRRKSDLVVTSSCIWDRDLQRSVWTQADPSNVMDTQGDLVQAADITPTPACGCESLVLHGTVQDEEGKIWECTFDPEVDEEGNTIITDDNNCQLICDGLLVLDLFCAEGIWSIDYLTSASDIFCYGTSSSYTEISTYWPPNRPTTTQSTSTTTQRKTSTTQSSSTTTTTQSTSTTTTTLSTTSQSTTCRTFVGNTSIIVGKDNQLNEGEELPVWGPVFEVKMDVKINSWSGDWGSIFRFSSIPGDYIVDGCEIGQRIPAMWTAHGTNDQLHLTTNIDSTCNQVFQAELGTFKPGVWYNFLISQSKDLVRIKIELK